MAAMTQEMAKIKDSWEKRDKTLEYLKQIQDVKNEMDHECKKIIAEMEKGVKAKIKMAKFEELKDELEIAKKLKEDAQNKIVQLQPNLQSLTKEVVVDIQDRAKLFKIERRRRWDEYYMKIACLAALRSKDPRTPVGACIAKWPTAKSDSNSYRIAGIGYNSMPYVEGEDNDSLFPWKRRHTESTPQDPTHTDSTAEGSTSKGSTAEGSTSKGSTAEGSTSKGSTAEGSTSKGSTAEGSTSKGSTAEGSTSKGSTAEGSTSKGSTAEGSTPASKDPKIDPKIDPTLKHAYVVHAAVNAILNKTRESIEGCTIYLTHFPDNDCVHAIIEAEIREVAYLKWKNHKEKDYDRIKELLVNNSVELREIMSEDINEEEDLKVVTELEYRINDKSVDVDKAAKTIAISWEQFFMGIAELSKTRPGEDKNFECIVGACIVSPSKQVMAVGYSGYPEDMDTISNDKYQGYYMSHAEYKAIIKTPSVKGCTLYVTREPCCVCAKMIVQAGISKVIYKHEGEGDRYLASKITLQTCLKIRKTEVKTVWNRSTEQIPRPQ